MSPSHCHPRAQYTSSHNEVRGSQVAPSSHFISARGNKTRLFEGHNAYISRTSCAITLPRAKGRMPQERGSEPTKVYQANLNIPSEAMSSGGGSSGTSVCTLRRHGSSSSVRERRFIRSIRVQVNSCILKFMPISAVYHANLAHN